MFVLVTGWPFSMPFLGGKTISTPEYLSLSHWAVVVHEDWSYNLFLLRIRGVRTKLLISTGKYIWFWLLITPWYISWDHERLKIKFSVKEISPELPLHFNASSFKTCEKLVFSIEISPYFASEVKSKAVFIEFISIACIFCITGDILVPPARGIPYSPLTCFVFLPTILLTSCHLLGGHLTHRYFKTKTNYLPTLRSLRSFLLLSGVRLD